MSDDQLRKQFNSHVGGIFMAAATLARLLDRPGMTIEYLRMSHAAGIFRDQVKSCGDFFAATLAAAPPEVITPEEKKFLSYWYGEIDRAETREPRGSDGVGV